MRKMLNEWRKFLEEDSEDKWALNPDGHEPLTRDQRRSASYHSGLSGGDEPAWIQVVGYAVGVLEAMESTHMDEPTLVAKVAEKMVMDPETVQQALATREGAAALRENGVMLGDDGTYNKPGKGLGV